MYAPFNYILQLNSHVNAFHRKFVHAVRSCDEMDRAIRFLDKEMKRARINIPGIDDDKPDVPAPKELHQLEVGG